MTLGEGNTPLVRSRQIGARFGLPNLYFKLESCNPTGSYKDRFAAVAVSHVLAAGKKRCIATSSGNAGAALAAACAVARIACRIAIVEGAPAEKIQQMAAYGADLFTVPGFGRDAEVTEQVLHHIHRLGSAPEAAVQITAYRWSPRGMSGVQTISYELAESWQQPLDHVFVPAGGGGLTLAVARGFSELVRLGQIPASPRIECVQPEGNDTMAGALRDGLERGRDVTVCTSKISGLQVPHVVDADEVIQACRDCGGSGHIVSDEEVWQAQALLGREEGIFSEPAGAVALAAALKARNEGRIDPDAAVACLVTGSGFKDRASVERMVEGNLCKTIDLVDLATSD
jgi:threonine synthase